jgi:hypothetical protein
MVAGHLGIRGTPVYPHAEEVFKAVDGVAVIPLRRMVDGDVLDQPSKREHATNSLVQSQVNIRYFITCIARMQPTALSR